MRTLLVVCTSWLLAGAWAVPRWSRARRTDRRDELLRRLLTGTVVPTGLSGGRHRPAHQVVVTVAGRPVGPADRLRLGDVVGEVGG